MFKEAKAKSEYSGLIDLVLEKKDDKTIATKKFYEGLVKVSPTIKMDRENIPTFYLLQLGGGYIEGEKYKNNVILYKDAIYKQVNNIYLDESSTLIYSDGITAGWSPEGDNFKYKSVQLKSNVYVNNKLVLLDNLIVNPINNDVTKLGFFEEYSNFGTLLVINKNVDDKVITELREVIRKLNLPVDFGISKLEVNGFVLRVLGNLTQHIEQVTGVCHNYIRKSFLGSKDLIIRKY